MAKKEYNVKKMRDCIVRNIGKLKIIPPKTENCAN